MTPLEIAELFIRAAEVDRRLPDTASPKKLKAQSLPYVHDQADQNGWGEERYQEERADFFNSRLSHEQVSEWERCNQLIAHVKKEGCRRALWAWAKAKAGGKPFARWCRENDLNTETARKRKNRAILEIFANLSRSNGQNIQNGLNGVLLIDPKNGHIHVTIGDNAETKQALTWRDDFSLTMDPDEQDFSWAEARNERRRQKYASMKKAA